MNQLQNDILSIFIDRNILELQDIEISRALNDKGICCLTNEVLTHLKSLSPILFQLEKNGPFMNVRLEPEVRDNFS